MAIVRPITKTLISSATWGIPITDAVNQNTTDIAGLRPPAGINMTLTNGWTASPPATYRKVNGFLVLTGSISGGTTGAVFANLPSGYRPVATITLVVYAWTSGGNGYALLSIKANGDLQVDNSNVGTASVVSLNGISVLLS